MTIDEISVASCAFRVRVILMGNKAIFNSRPVTRKPQRLSEVRKQRSEDRKLNSEGGMRRSENINQSYPLCLRPYDLRLMPCALSPNPFI